jgi:hypothetical protein
MNAAGHPRTSDSENNFSMARIDGQDVAYVFPIREYLESHGIEVVVNRAPATAPLYHIVAGDASYVKQIFSREHAGDEKRLGIILGGGKTAEEFSGKLKLILADPVPMTEIDVVEVFEFFFTEGKNHLDIRRTHETRTVHEPSEQAAVDDARVRSIIADVYKEDATPDIRAFHEKKKRRTKRLHAWALGVLICIGLIIIPPVWYGISMMIGGYAIVSGAKALREGNFSAVAWNTSVADYWTHQGEFVIAATVMPFSWVGWQDSLRGQQRLVSFMKDAADAQKQAHAITAVASRVASGLLNQVDATSTGTTPATDISDLRISLYSLGNTLGLAQAELTMLLADRTFPFSIHAIREKGMGAVADLSDIRRSTGDMDKLLSLFISIAGFKEPRTYLVLLQNSMELRATGGFIGSVALASFADGRLTNLDVQDVYTFDGQLKGHVDPPTPLKDLMGEEHWYLRDSNWDPDFKAAGAQAAWFYQKETGTTVDGVIAISTPFITDLLKATGPIELTDYKDRISAENFYGKSIYYTQNDFFPGSTQKKDFLGSLSRGLLAQITTGKNVNMTKLFGAITTAIAGHDLVTEFPDSALESLVEHYGWAGRVPPEVGCVGTDTRTCVFDPFISVEANLGVNKVNYFVTRTLTRTIRIHDDGTRTETATIAIRNGSGQKDKNLPYISYIRFVLPPGTSVEEISIDGAPVRSRSGKGLPVLPYIETSTVSSGWIAAGVAFEIPASAEKQLTITLTDPTPLQFGKSGAILEPFIQKQAGVSGETVHTIITYPGGWTAGLEDTGSYAGTRGFIAKQGQLEYNTTLTRDDLTRIRFTK